MHEEPHIEIPEPAPERTGFSFALSVAAAAVVIVLAAFYLWPGRQSPSRGGAQEIHPPFSPLRRAKRWMDFLSSSAGWRLASRPQIKRRQHDHHGGRGHAKRKAEPRAFWFWLGNLDVRLFVNEFRVKRGCAIRYAKI